MQAGRQTETVIPVYNANHDLHWSVVVVFLVGQVARPSHSEDPLFFSTFKSWSYHYGSKSRSCHYARINLLCIHPQFKGSTGVHADGGKCLAFCIVQTSIIKLQWFFFQFLRVRLCSLLSLFGIFVYLFILNIPQLVSVVNSKQFEFAALRLILCILFCGSISDRRQFHFSSCFNQNMCKSTG